jgi:hypothetical protein
LLILFSFLGSCFHRPLDQQLWFFPISCTSPSFLVLISVVALRVLHPMLYFHSCFFQTKNPSTHNNNGTLERVWDLKLYVAGCQAQLFMCTRVFIFVPWICMYVSPLHICFHSNIFGKQLKVSFSTT